MNIAEAVEIVKNPTGIDPWGYEMDNAVDTIVAEYLRLTDPTPLTVELIEKELGEPRERWPRSCGWRIEGNEVRFTCDNKLFVNGSSFYWIKTLGDLRWLVSKLRGGAA